MGADPNARASDGTTPFYEACAKGHMAVLHILRDHGADMTTVDQDGTSPALIAAANGRCAALQMLHESGVDLQATGHIYNGEFTVLRRNVTPLTTARDCGQHAAVAYLESVILAKNQKRARSDQPMLERAVKAGVADRLKPIPHERLLESTKAGSGTPI